LRTFIVLLALAGVAAAPAPPFAYVGKLQQGGERYAVLQRADAVLVVRAGDAIGGEYRVQSVADERVLVVHLASGAVQTLPFSSSQTSSKSAAADAAGLRVAGPSTAAVGDQFMVTVNTGDNGSLELQFDPKVLQLRGPEAEGAVDGSARIETPGEAATVQFRVVAREPTATVIRIVGDEGQAAHRLAIVPKGN
jgi:hypothetical protein